MVTRTVAVTEGSCLCAARAAAIISLQVVMLSPWYWLVLISMRCGSMVSQSVGPVCFGPNAVLLLRDVHSCFFSLAASLCRIEECLAASFCAVLCCSIPRSRLKSNPAWRAATAPLDAMHICGIDMSNYHIQVCHCIFSRFTFICSVVQ